MQWLTAAQIPGMVVGGVASSILGRPRLTRDVDLRVLLPQERWAEAVARAADFAITARMLDPVSFAVKSRVLLLRHAPSAIRRPALRSGMRSPAASAR
jgi:hypothetical protein